MDALRFADLLLKLFPTPTRRAMLGLGAAGLLAALGLDDADAKKRRKGNGKKKKKMCRCIACARCKNGKCKRVPEGTPCGDGKQCSADGQCLTPPSLCQQRCGDCNSCLVKTDGSVLCSSGGLTWGCLTSCSSDSDCVGTGRDHCVARQENPETGEGSDGLCAGSPLPRCANVSPCVA